MYPHGSMYTASSFPQYQHVVVLMLCHSAMIRLQKPSSSEVRVSLREMVAASQRLRSECTQSGHADIALRTRQIISSAYDVAKAARHLVLCCEQDRK